MRRHFHAKPAFSQKYSDDIYKGYNRRPKEYLFSGSCAWCGAWGVLGYFSLCRAFFAKKGFCHDCKGCIVLPLGGFYNIFISTQCKFRYAERIYMLCRSGGLFGMVHKPRKSKFQNSKADKESFEHDFSSGAQNFCKGFFRAQKNYRGG